MLNGMVLPPVVIEDVADDTEHTKNWLETLESRRMFAASGSDAELQPVAVEMALHHEYHTAAPAAPAKRPAGTPFNWNGFGGESLCDSAPVVVASQKVAPVSTVGIGQSLSISGHAMFSNKQIAA